MAMDLHLKKGALHKQMGVAQDKKIPAKKLESAAKGKGGELERKRAQFAINAKKWHHGGSHAKVKAGLKRAFPESK
jgi:hypothetical protein